MTCNGDAALNKMNQTRWLSLMEQLGFSDNLAVFSELYTAYSEPHRRYHTVKHIDAVLKHLDSASALIENIEQVELALWFHDAVYAPFSSSNERDSARWAVQFLRDNNASTSMIDNVETLIMATVHSAKARNADEALLVDIDLSILGVKPEVYQQFESDVRFEYRRVPYFLYKKKRKEVLQSFLSRETIYQSEFFIDKFEVQARVNLQAALCAL